MNRPLRLLAALAAPVLIAATPSAYAADRENVDAYALAPAVTRASAALMPRAGARVASRDPKTGAPTMLFAGGRMSKARAGATAETAGRQHLATYAAHYGVSGAAVGSAELHHVHDIGRGAIVATFRQKIAGVEIFHHDAKVMMNRALDLVAIGGGLHRSGAAPRGARFALGPAEAISAGFADLFGPGVGASEFAQNGDAHDGYAHFELSMKGQSAHNKELERPARAKKVWFALPDRLVPGYYLEIFARTPKTHALEAFGYVIAADDGRVLYRENLTHYDQYNYRVWADEGGDHRPKDGPTLDYTPYPAATPNGSYPGYAAPSLIAMEGFNKNPGGMSDPWLPPNATVTTGNNVDAYTDDDSPEGFSSQDIRASTTADHTFDRLYDFTLDPRVNDTQRQASVTQLFYVTNWMHDYWYDSGFNEAAGNAQKDNFNRGGVDNDPLQAQGQDGQIPGQPDDPQSMNNSNMNVPADGSPPVMQMYIWSGQSDRTLTVNGAGYVSGSADFGPTEFDVAGDLVLAVDGSAPTSDACSALVNGVAGKIVLVDRGTCSFQSKADVAQSAGAIGVIIANNVAGELGGMAGDDTQPPTVIPVLGVSQSSGAALKALLTAGAASVTMHGHTDVDRDGTIDNTVSAHEWGHYLHLRQVQGCVDRQCSGQSEGWADFNALMMVFRPGDPHQGIYPMAVYATASFPFDPAYFGIRRYPYSANLAVNPLTFKHVSADATLPSGPPLADMGTPNNEAHSVGEVWASMLFQAYVALLDRATGAGAPYTEDEAHRRMADYVETALQMSPADPTITEQRDAVLAAAAASDKDDFVAMAKAFAKRGAGSCAVSPDRASRDLTGVVEDFDVSANAAITTLTLDDGKTCDHDGYIDPGEKGTVTVEITNTGAAKLSGAKLTVTSSSKDLAIGKGGKADLPDLAPYESTKLTFDATLADGAKGPLSGVVTATLDASGGCAKQSTSAVSFHADADEKKAASATDDVEAKSSAWTPFGAHSSAIWQQTDLQDGNHAWVGVDYDAPSDTQLVSPSLDVGADDLTLEFDHAHSFEASGGTNYDGAVIEVSTDDGASWADISTLGDPGYGGVIGDMSMGATNVLKGRSGYVATNKSYPKLDHVKIDLGKKLAKKTVKVRFRIASDDAQGEPGWTIDNIAFKGLTNTPFAALVADSGACTNEGSGGAGGAAPTTSSSSSSGTGVGGGDVTGSSDSGDGCGCELPGRGAFGGATPALAVMAALGAMLRRRRRRS